MDRGRPALTAPNRLAGLVREMLVELGEDPDREGLVDTPRRVADAMQWLLGGSACWPEEVVGGALFEEQHDEMVLLRDIPFFSLCEHHLLPFFGVVHVAYLPNGRVVGLSKVPRLVDVYTRRLQLQERLTREIADALQSVTGAQGVGVVCSARHLCMEMRGVRRTGVETVTSTMLGAFRSDSRTRNELMELIRR